MKKKFAFLIGASICAAAALAGTAAIANNGPLANRLVQDAKADHEFSISSDAPLTPSNEDYYATATSAVGWPIQFKFSGFEMENEKLISPTNGRVYATNVDEIGKGFDSVSFSFHTDSSEESRHAACGIYFSYFPMTLEGIASGSYGDIRTLLQMSLQADSNGDLNISINSTIAGVYGLEDCRYMFAILSSEVDFTFEGLSFSTPCADPAPAVEPSEYTDYTDNEKAQIAAQFAGQSIPFVGNSSYTLANPYMLRGFFLNSNLKDDFESALVTDGYTLNYQSEYGNVFQKKIEVDDEEVVLTVSVGVDLTNPLIPYSIQFDTDQPWIGTYDEWPVEEFSVFSSDYATFLSNHPFLEGNKNIRFSCTSYSGPSIGVLQITISGITIDEDFAASMVDYLLGIIADPDRDFAIATNEWDSEECTMECVIECGDETTVQDIEAYCAYGPGAEQAGFTISERTTIN